MHTHHDPKGPICALSFVRVLRALALSRSPRGSKTKGGKTLKIYLYGLLRVSVTE